MHSVASRQLTGGNIVHLVLPSVIVSGANSAICSNEQTWKQPPGPIHHTLPLQEGCKTIPFHCRDHHSSNACPFSAVDPGIMLASRILSELSGLMTLRSKAAGRDKDQLGTRTSAGRMRSLQPKLQPFSTSGARPAIWQKCARQSRRRLCRAMTNPPCLQVSEWWPIASRAEEQKGHRFVRESKGNPNQNLRRTCIPEDSRFKPKLGDGVALSQA